MDAIVCTNNLPLIYLIDLSHMVLARLAISTSILNSPTITKQGFRFILEQVIGIHCSLDN